MDTLISLRGGSWGDFFGLVILVWAVYTYGILPEAPMSEPAQLNAAYLLGDPETLFASAFQPTSSTSKRTDPRPSVWQRINYVFRHKHSGPTPSKSTDMQIYHAPRPVYYPGRPADMPHEEYSNLSSYEKRQLPDERDKMRDVEGKSKLDVGYQQVLFKLPKHGKDHGLEANEKGKVAKTDKNGEALQNSIVEMGENPNTVWYTDGGYQGGTPDGRDTINLLDTETNLISIFVKRPDGSNKFLSTFKITPRERNRMEKNNGNFVSEAMLDKLELDKQPERSVEYQVDTQKQPETSPNPDLKLGFTARNTFESDVTKFTKIDPSVTDNK